MSTVSQNLIVELEHLTVKYGARIALNDVTLRIGEGIVGLLGPNGAGKSTLLKTLLGFCAPAKGNARVLGAETRHGSREIRRSIGYMPERDVTSPKLSAVSFVSYCGTLAGMPYRDALQRAHEVLNYVGFGEERYRVMGTYSTGMRQRTKLAQALVHDPRVLFLDEPTNGLDPMGRIAMLDLISDVARQRGVAILLSSHLLPDVEHVCERVVLMDQGRIVREGSVSELTRLRSDRYAVRVRDGAEAFEEHLRTSGFVAEIAHDGKVHVTLSAGQSPADLFRLAHARGFQLRDVVPVRQRLEDIFLEAISGAHEIS